MYFIFQLDETFMSTTGSLNLTSPFIQPYDVKVEFKKDFSDVENTLVCGLQVKQGSQNNFVSIAFSLLAI